MTTYAALLQSRKNFRNGKARGFEWNPSPLPYAPLETEDNGIPQAIDRVLALAMQLELPVGEWVATATKKELPISNTAMELLLSNITDETVHYKAFSNAVELYPLSDRSMLDSSLIASQWMADNSHPIEKAMISECGVFLCSLAFLRLFGGVNLGTLAANVSRDEVRHVATNRGVMQDLGYNFMQPTKSLFNLSLDTVEWMIDGVTVPGLDKDFFLEQSQLLITQGYAPELEELTDGAQDYAPFESDNRNLY